MQHTLILADIAQTPQPIREVAPVRLPIVPPNPPSAIAIDLFYLIIALAIYRKLLK